MTQHTKATLTVLLREKGLRVTGHRLAILLLFAKRATPMTVYELLATLRKKDDIDQATIYRTMTSLHEAGIIRRLDFNHGHAHYELETGKPSHQVICNTCETVEKIEGVSVSDAVKKMLKKSRKFSGITTHAIELYGTCRSCAQRK